MTKAQKAEELLDRALEEICSYAFSTDMPKSEMRKRIRSVCNVIEQQITPIIRTASAQQQDDVNAAEYEIMKKRVEHYKRENAALRAEIEIYKTANKDELQ